MLHVYKKSVGKSVNKRKHKNVSVTGCFSKQAQNKDVPQITLSGSFSFSWLPVCEHTQCEGERGLQSFNTYVLSKQENSKKGLWSVAVKGFKKCTADFSSRQTNICLHSSFLTKTLWHSTATDHCSMEYSETCHATQTKPEQKHCPTTLHWTFNFLAARLIYLTHPSLLEKTFLAVPFKDATPPVVT